MSFMINVVGVIQARMSSRRLPGKAMLPIEGLPVLAHVVRRTQQARGLSDVIVATSTHASDDIIYSWCEENRVLCVRGSLEDVLGRYNQAAEVSGADAVLRVTGDCPVIDPEILTLVIEGYLLDEVDCYGLSGQFPNGLDCTIYSASALRKASLEATWMSQREHVGLYIENSGRFKCSGLEYFENMNHHRWSLDEFADYKFLRAVFSALSPNIDFGFRDIVKLLESQPRLAKINAGVKTGAGLEKSLENDFQVDLNSLQASSES